MTMSRYRGRLTGVDTARLRCYYPRIMRPTQFVVVENAISKGLGGGTGDLFFTDAGLYFILYAPDKASRALANMFRPEDWGLKLEDRVRKRPGSFFVEKAALISHDFSTLKVETTKQPSGLVSTREFRILRVMSPNAVYEFFRDEAALPENDIQSYFLGLGIFDETAFERRGLRIEFSAPSTVIEHIQAGTLGEKIPREELLKAAGDPTYMAMFTHLFMEKLPSDKRLEGFELIARHAPPEFMNTTMNALKAKAAEHRSTLVAGAFGLVIGAGFMFLARSLHHWVLLKGLLALVGIVSAGGGFIVIMVSLFKGSAYNRFLNAVGQTMKPSSAGRS